VLAGLFLPPLLLYLYRSKEKPLKMVYAAILFLLPSLLTYFLQVDVYIKYYLPVHYDIRGLVNPHLMKLGPLFDRYADMFSQLLTGTFSVRLYAHIFLIFVVLLAAELLFIRHFSREARNWLYAVCVVFLGIGFLGFLLPLFDLANTTKRALFKLLPLVVMYMATNGWLQRLSGMLSRSKVSGASGSGTSAGAKAAARRATAGKAPALAKGAVSNAPARGVTGEKSPGMPTGKGKKKKNR